MPRNEVDVSKEIMDKISTGEVKMRSRWYFVLGSAAMVLGLIGAAVLAVFCVSLISFSLRTHGPMGSYRLAELLASFPWWAPLLAIAGFILGVWLLRKYDFSYKRNVWAIVAIFLAGVILAGVAIDLTGLSDILMKQGFMRRYGQQSGQGSGQGLGRGQGTGIGSGTIKK